MGGWVQIVEGLSTRHLGKDFSHAAVRGDLSAASVDSLAASFPLCMRNLLGRVREDHHLKHGGRMQLGLFIKVRLACNLHLVLVLIQVLVLILILIL